MESLSICLAPFKAVSYALCWLVKGLRLSTLCVYGTIVSLLWWIYYKLITEPLRLFYFVGPVWGNVRPEQVCFELTGVDSGWWNTTDDRLSECQRLLNTRFHSFEVTILCVLYFASAVFAVLYLVCRCCFLRPFVNEMQRLAHVR